MRITDWSSDVCSSDLLPVAADPAVPALDVQRIAARVVLVQLHVADQAGPRIAAFEQVVAQDPVVGEAAVERLPECGDLVDPLRSEEHTSELQSPMRLSDAGFCLKQT